MNWTGRRRLELPANWRQIRTQILERDNHQCVAITRDGDRCTEPATEVDHIRRGNDHTPDNLQALCGWHHKRKTQAEAREAAANVPRITTRRPDEKHPGLS